MKGSATRLYAILAREARVGVVFRRGPTKQVQLLRWDLAEDRIEPGQWFKERIYERRCDLSPDGKKLIYFAASAKPPFFSWTAVSTPPYLSALALWPNGTAWGGGGLFVSGSHIVLNQRPECVLLPHGHSLPEGMRLADGFSLPPDVKVEPFGQRPGGGEDSPILEARLARDGWRDLVTPRQREEHHSQLLRSLDSATEEHSRNITWSFDPPWIHAREAPGGHPRRIDLEMCLEGIHERNGPWYVIRYRLFAPDTRDRMDLGLMDWADWDVNGDMLFARDGRLFRLRPAEEDGLASAFDPTRATEIADFRGARFEEVTPPPEALRW